ncbi:hypothetical protein [Aquimarina aggregata]|nr:hypothetical protein [Aquimarina aggregata]
MKSNDDYNKDERDNRSNQLNPNNDSYWKSRGEDKNANTKENE